jgi:lysozyme
MKFNPDEIVIMVKRHEGYKRFPYLCTSGALTVGCGRNLRDKGISEREAEMLLLNDLAEATQEVLRNIPFAKDLSRNRLNVLVMLTFNIGIGGALGFRKMLMALKNGDYDKAADELLASKWSKQVKGRADELALIMRTDKFPTDQFPGSQ